MKETFQAFFLLLILLLASCTKSSTPGPSVPSQTWIFKSVTYHTVECFADTNTGNLGLHANDASSQNQSDYSSVLCNFYGPSLPTANGTYAVALVNTPPASITATQVTISLTNGGTTNVYQSTGGNGHEMVNVTVNNGKLSISATGIELENYNSSTVIDSAQLSFNITQTQ